MVQNSALLLLHGALASNTLDIRRVLTISRCYLDVLLVFLRLAIAFEQVLISGSTHMPVDFLTFRGSEGSSDVVLCTVLLGMPSHDCSHSPRGRLTSAPSI